MHGYVLRRPVANCVQVYHTKASPNMHKGTPLEATIVYHFYNYSTNPQRLTRCITKVSPEDHSKCDVDIAQDVCPRMHISREVAETLLESMGLLLTSHSGYYGSDGKLST